MDTTNQQIGTICTCDRHAPSKWKLTSVPFLEQLARDQLKPELPVPQIVYRAIDELYSHGAGTLLDLKKKPIDLFEEFKDGLDVVEWAFGGDWARGMRRLLERAERPFRNQMKANDKLLMRVLLLHYARKIHRCRTSGPCSERKPDQK